jgi:NAD(P)-dependent dehydrogenase (short-subunit alcohol dehydrogenase family)
VVILARNEEAGRALAAKTGSRFMAADVLDRSSLEKAAAELGEPVDVLINCAGGNQPGATVPPDKTIFDLDIDAMRRVVDLNLFGTVLPTLAFGRAMCERGRGSIINVASESALRPLTRVAGYGVAKAAVVNLTKYLAGEIALKFGEGVRVNAIAPGFFISEQNRTLLTNPDGSLTARGETIIRHTPFGRFGEPDELLGTLHYLASDAWRFVTGTVAVVDGGFDAFSI